MNLPSKGALGALAICALLTSGCGKTLKQFAYEGFDRDDWQEPEKIIEALEIQPGSQIADLGAGSGYFTFDLARATGPQGHVWAVDVDPDMIEVLREKAAAEKASNVTVVLAPPDDPDLPDGKIDLVFTSNTYHHIEDQPAYFARLAKDLAPNARIAILEFRPDAGWVQKWSGHATPVEEIRKEMTAAGYALTEQPTLLDRQSFLIFERLRAPSKRPPPGSVDPIVE